MNKDIVISIKTVVATALMFFGVYLIVRLGPLLLTVVISLLVVMALEPGVRFFKKTKFMNKPIPRSLAVGIMFLVTVVVIILILTVGLPPVVSQSQKLLVNLSGLITKIPFLQQKEDVFKELIPQISSLSGNVLTVTFSIFSNFVTLISVLFISIYMSLDWENIKKRFYSLFTGKTKDEMESLVEEVEANIGHWVKGQLLLMVVVGISSFLGLMLLGVNYPLALGLVAGLFEIVPVLGPVLTAVLAAAVGFAESPIKGFATIGLFILIQQLENNFLVPKVMQKVSGFSPLVILLALLIGSNFFGIVGAVIAIPITMVLVVIVKHFLRYSNK